MTTRFHWNRRRVLVYRRYLRMHLHCQKHWRFNAQHHAGFRRLEQLLLNRQAYLDFFHNHYPYNSLHLDDFYHFVEQIVREFNLPRQLLTLFEHFCGLNTAANGKHSHSNPHPFPAGFKTSKVAVLRI